MKIDFTQDEIAMLAAIVIGLSDDIEEMFSDDESEFGDRARSSIASLSFKVVKANMEVMAREYKAKDAENLAEEADE